MLQDLSTTEDANDAGNDKNSKSCFSQSNYSKLSLKQPILSDVFKTAEKKLVYLHLYPACLIFSFTKELNADSKVEVLQFSFTTTFFISLKKSTEIKKYSALKFLNMDDRKSQSFYSEDSNIINKWAAILINYINQIGIQEYYKTIKHLGKGVSADVYLAERISDGKPFAIKVFNKSKNNQKCLNAFISELKIMRLLNHSNIIKLYGVFVSNEFIYAILEYLSGGNLYEQIKSLKRYTKEQQFVILKNLAEGTQHLRHKRIVHRDLKLENILIRKIGERKEYVICDFGLATWLDEKSYIFEKCGTPGYIAPEVLRLGKEQKLELTNKVDIYSLGSIFHVIILLRPVFIYEGDFKVLLKLNKKSEIDWSQNFYFNISQDQLRMLQLMLESNPDKRINSENLLKLEYFKRRSSNRKYSEQFKIEVPKTQNLQTMAGSLKILRNNDNRSGSSQVKQERETSLKRNSSLTKQIKFGEKQKTKSSIFDIFRRKKSATGSMNNTDLLSPKKEQVKSLVTMSTTIQCRQKSSERKGALDFLFKRS